MERSPASSEYAAKLFSYPPESIVDFGNKVLIVHKCVITVTWLFFKFN